MQKKDMRILRLNKSISIETIKSKMKIAKTVSEYKRWQIIYLISSYQVDAEYLSDITGYSKASIYGVVQQFNSKTTDVSPKSKGGRRRELMTIEDEAEVMKAMENKALKGQILSYRDVKKAVESKVGKVVSDDYIWDLFKRNGWTKHSPRPHHPQKDTSKQDEFKKNSKTIWLPLKMILTSH